MCDYSLERLASRPAAVGDKLVSTRFGDSITRGFAAVGEPTVAVCLRPGTEIAFEGPVVHENLVSAIRETIPDRVARFKQVDMDTRHVHHDALEFPGGRTVLLTRLVPGQKAKVLQLPATEAPAKAAERTAETVARAAPARQFALAGAHRF